MQVLVGEDPLGGSRLRVLPWNENFEDLHNETTDPGPRKITQALFYILQNNQAWESGSIGSGYFRGSKQITGKKSLSIIGWIRVYGKIYRVLVPKMKTWLGELPDIRLNRIILYLRKNGNLPAIVLSHRLICLASFNSGFCCQIYWIIFTCAVTWNRRLSGSGGTRLNYNSFNARRRRRFSGAGYTGSTAARRNDDRLVLLGA